MNENLMALLKALDEDDGLLEAYRAAIASRARTHLEGRWSDRAPRSVAMSLQTSV